MKRQAISLATYPDFTVLISIPQLSPHFDDTKTEFVGMKINITTMGGLKKFQPAEKSLHLPESITVAQVLEQLGIAADQVQVVLVNGSPQGDRSYLCQEDDTLTILPIVGGG